MPSWPRSKQLGYLMHSRKLIFSQLMEHLLKKALARLSKQPQDPELTCQDQFLCIAFAQLTFRESLRNIEACSRSRTEKLYHMGIRGLISRNTLANGTRDRRIYADFAQRLIGIARKLYIN